MLKKKAVLMGKILGATVLSAMIMVGLAMPAKAARAPLAVTDCVKCHEKEPATIAANESKHKTAVSCLECHLEHGPWGKAVIPQCAMCHEGKSHYKLENCSGCHVDPHNPLGIAFSGNLVAPCLTCHEQQGKEFKEHPSKHAQQACNFCHDKHKLIPECFQCHEPHAKGQTMADCLACHPVHQPRTIVPDVKTQRGFCVPCHEDIGALMAKTTTKHQAFTCVFCHNGPHPTVPKCQGCHGEPHSATMHQKMPKCIDCHIDPHNLQK